MNMNNALKHVTGAFTYTPIDKELRFGSGNPSDECNCETVTVFARVVGATNQLVRSTFPKDTKLGDLKSVFERHPAFKQDIRQELLADEQGYIWSSEDEQRPLTAFSNRCRLNVDFVPKNSTVSHVVENISDTIQKKIGKPSL